MNKQFIRYLQKTLLALDLVLLNVVFLLSCLFIKGGIPSVHFADYMVYLCLSNVLWLILSFSLRVYADKVIIVFESFTRRSMHVYFLWVVVIFMYLVFFHQTNISRIFLSIAMLGFGAILFFNRFLYLAVKKYHERNASFVNNILILGYNETSKKLSKYFEEEGLRTRILGFIDDNENINELSRYPIFSGIKNTMDTAIKLHAQEIYSTISPEQNKEIYSIIERAEGEFIRFKIVPDLSLFFNRNMHIDYFNDLPVISLRSHALDDVGNKLKKRMLDVVFSGLVIVFILWWLIPLLALLIKLESKGPVFFKQLRTGKNNKDFYCLKFRSMRQNKESDAKQATRGDARVTTLGKILRKTSLDEFPQFLNVFKGEMSLVGPRPHMLKHTTDYSKMVDDYMVRQFLKPGITGWAQVNGFRGEITNVEQIDQRVRKDLWYLENWTLTLDIQILFLTVYKIFKGDKNAF